MAKFISIDYGMGFKKKSIGLPINFLNIIDKQLKKKSQLSLTKITKLK